MSIYLSKAEREGLTSIYTFVEHHGDGATDYESVQEMLSVLSTIIEKAKKARFQVMVRQEVKKIRKEQKK